jgi:allantoin racemase
VILFNGSKEAWLFLGGVKMHKILVINSNSNSRTTRGLMEKLGVYVGKETEITCVNPHDGPQVIDTRMDLSIGAIETIRLVARNKGLYDAFVVACGLDPGLDECRSIVKQPVIGLAEAGMLTACTLCRRFAVLTHTESSVSIVQDLIRHYGFESRLASVRAIRMSGAEMADHDTMVHKMEVVSRQAVIEDRAELIVLPGVHWVGLEGGLSKKVGVPVLSGAVCALRLAEFLIDYGQETSRSGSYQKMTRQDQLIGYDDLQDVFRSEI